MALYTNPSTINMTNPVGIFSYIGEVTTFYFFNVYDVLLVGLWFLILAGTYKTTDDIAWALGVSGFGIFLLGLLLWMGGLITGYTMGIYIGMVIIGVVAYLLS
jgi:hypothetical protein